MRLVNQELIVSGVMYGVTVKHFRSFTHWLLQRVTRGHFIRSLQAFSAVVP